jgi:hypothetical protein
MTVRGLVMKDLPLTPPDFFTPFLRTAGDFARSFAD